MLPKNNFFLLVFSILISQLAGVIGSFFSISSIPTWYATLTKPFFNPPNWLFGPVWITLYTMMGISLYLIWHTVKSKKKDTLIKLFLGQLVLNALWSIVFFGAKQLGLAIIVIGLLWTMIVSLIRGLFPLNRTAAWLLVPYIAWVSFAALLNIAVWYLN
ncbi:MAG: tryptophan-rich sensory protein [Pseudomonadales bacterium]|nr:tryptophan-rich sensory protein [Pseudomonadales bacterium]